MSEKELIFIKVNLLYALLSLGIIYLTFAEDRHFVLLFYWLGMQTLLLYDKQINKSKFTAKDIWLSCGSFLILLLLAFFFAC